MRTTKHLFVVAVGLIVCLIIVWFSTSIQGEEKTYEVKHQITLPEYRTDTARAIDAYERVMDRFMNLTQRSLTGINTDIKDIAKNLVSIDRKLTQLSARMARIERAVGIKQLEKPVEKGCKVKPHNHNNTTSQLTFEESVCNQKSNIKNQSAE
jgi:hypothetical protein